MTDDELLRQKRDAVLERWFLEIAATYPEDTARFLRDRKDRFHNPVGHALKEGVARMFDSLLGEVPDQELRPALDTVVRVRAVQEFTPSAAVGFVFMLRRILDEELPGGALGPGLRARVDAATERLALLAFDIYMQCRERLFEIKVRELRERQLLAARAAGV